MRQMGKVVLRDAPPMEISGTIDAVTNVPSVDLIDEVTNITSLDLVDEITEVANVTSVDTIDDVTNVTSVDTVDTLTSITNPVLTDTIGIWDAVSQVQNADNDVWTFSYNSVNTKILTITYTDETKVVISTVGIANA